MLLKFKISVNMIYRWRQLIKPEILKNLVHLHQEIFSEILYNYSIGLLMKEVLMILNLWIKIK